MPPLFIVSEFHVRHGKSLHIRRRGGYKCGDGGDELCTIFAALGEHICNAENSDKTFCD